MLTSPRNPFTDTQNSLGRCLGTPGPVKLTHKTKSHRSLKGLRHCSRLFQTVKGCCLNRGGGCSVFTWSHASPSTGRGAETHGHQ